MSLPPALFNQVLDCGASKSLSWACRLGLRALGACQPWGSLGTQGANDPCVLALGPLGPAWGCGVTLKGRVSKNSTEIQLTSRNSATTQKSSHCTEIQQLYRNPTTIQKSNNYTEILPLYRNPATRLASNHYTEIQPLYRNPRTIQKSNHYTEIQQLYRNPPT